MPTSAPRSRDESFQIHPTRKPHCCAAHRLSGGFQNPPHQPGLALPPSPSTAPAPQLCRDTEGRALMSANGICRKINPRCAQPTARRGRAGARRVWELGQEGRRRCPAGSSTLVCADSGHSAGASCSPVSPPR